MSTSLVYKYSSFSDTINALVSYIGALELKYIISFVDVEISDESYIVLNKLQTD